MGRTHREQVHNRRGIRTIRAAHAQISRSIDGAHGDRQIELNCFSRSAVSRDRLSA
jgi:hypothetical protein